MANRDWNKKEVLILDHGRRVSSIRRIIFDELGGYASDTGPDATGSINYKNAIAKVRRDAEGNLFVEMAEPLVQGHRPLTANWN